MGWTADDGLRLAQQAPAIKNADQRRELYLDRAQRIKFIEKAPVDLAAFLRGLCQLPLRPGALAKLKAGDFENQQQAGIRHRSPRG